MTYELILETIDNHCNPDILLEYLEHIPDHKFMTLSMEKWAINSLKERLLIEYLKPEPAVTGEDKIDPLDILEDYIYELEDYYSITGSSNTRYSLRCAIDILEELGSLFI